MNKIIFELSPEDRARLDAIIAKLDGLAPHCDDCVDNVLQVVEGAHPAKPATAPAPAARPTAEPESPPWTEPAPAPVAEPPSLAEFQRVVTERCVASPAVKAKVRELVNKYAPSVSEIPADKRHEFLAQLAAL